MTNKEVYNCFKFLEENGFLEYGNMIPHDVFEELIGCKAEQNWDFLGPFLQIREEIMLHGYLCTQRDIPFGCLKIYDAQEMMVSSDRLFNNLFNKIKKLKKCIISAKIDEFNDKEQKLYMHQANKLCSSVNALKSTLSNL